MSPTRFAAGVAVVMVSGVLMSGCTDSVKEDAKPGSHAAAVAAVPASGAPAGDQASGPPKDASPGGQVLPSLGPMVLPSTGGVGLLSCGEAEVGRNPANAFNSSIGCPRVLPVGPAVGELLGMSGFRRVRVDIPSQGWTAVEGVSPGGFELTGPHGGRVVLFADPNLIGGVSRGGHALYRGIAGLPEVRVVGKGPWNWDAGVNVAGQPEVTGALTAPDVDPGVGGTWIDLTPAPGAALSDDCRLTAPCLPLLSSIVWTGVHMELSSEHVSRLFLEDVEADRIQAAAWVRDITGPDAVDALKIVSSLELRDPGQPAP